MQDILLNDTQKDALKEIGNVCSGNAATALSQLFNTKIDIIVPRILFIPIEEVPNAVGGADKLIVGLILRVLGDIPSHILFVFSQKDAILLSSFITKKPIANGKVITEAERSALKEIGVILANAYVGALSSFLGMGLVPTVPELIADMAGAIVDYILIELSDLYKFALLIESEFCEASASIRGHFFLIPNPLGFQALINSVDRG